MLGERDRQETEAQVELAMQLLQVLVVKHREIPEESPKPLPGSILSEEQRLTARAPIDTLVAAHRSRAREFLDRIFDLMIDEEGARIVAYPFSIYALVRAAIESLATGMWLIQSDRKHDRVLRALQISYRNAQDALSLAYLTAPADMVAREEERLETIISRLNEIKYLTPILRQRELGYPPKYTGILKSVSSLQAGSREKYEFVSPINVWKITSAFLHGSDDLSRMLSDTRQLTDFVDGVATFEITPKMQLVASCVAECIQLMNRLDERFNYLCTHDYGGRPVQSP